MTGEITLRGRVLPIGGLKEKILAAHRSGITTVIMPKENAKDLRDIPKRVLKTLKVVPVEHMDEVLRAALVLPRPEEFLTEPSVPVDWRQPVERRERDADRRDEPSRMPVASAVPPPSAREESPDSRVARVGVARVTVGALQPGHERAAAVSGPAPQRALAAPARSAGVGVRLLFEMCSGRSRAKRGCAAIF